MLALGGCSLFTEADRPRVDIEVASLSYAPGDTVLVTFRNDDDAPWFFIAGCYSSIERRVDDAWTPIDEYCGLSRALDPRIDALTVAPIEVPARGSVVLQYPLPAEAAEGQYRHAATFFASPTSSGRNVRRVSPTFAVSSFSLGTR
jgi:hypothetical protein